ncbi:MAG: DUF4293 domain-containing protein [Saprospiraceae bacterium]|nr:DUF4293 domain-containing protein [Saprospiraceae bacterium]
MLQRIQSIFLLVSGAAFFLLFTVSFATSNKVESGIFADQAYSITDNPILIGLAGLGGALALFNIFNYRNRDLQLRLGYLIIVLCILLPLVAGLLLFTQYSKMASDLIIDDGLGIYLPILALITTILAIRFIKKDDKLVRSSDRLR